MIKKELNYSVKKEILINASYFVAKQITEEENSIENSIQNRLIGHILSFMQPLTLFKSEGERDGIK